jgi:hypothetical protein
MSATNQTNLGGAGPELAGWGWAPLDPVPSTFKNRDKLHPINYASQRREYCSPFLTSPLPKYDMCHILTLSVLARVLLIHPQQAKRSSDSTSTNWIAKILVLKTVAGYWVRPVVVR